MKTFDLGAVTAYALAVKNGFEGTVEEWLESLVPKISVGTVETGEPGSDVVVTMDGNAKTPVLNFRIPRGKPGAVTTVNGMPPDENGNVQVETSSQSDWNAAEGEPGHVLNRTHWTEGRGKVEILPECQPTYIPDDGMFSLEFASSLSNLVAGETYIVNWNGVEYPSVAVDGAAIVEPGIKLLGDVYTLSEGAVGTAPTGEPFVMAIALEQEVMIIPFDGTTELTLSIYQIGEIVHKLDNKYLDLGWLPSANKAVLIPEQRITDSTINNKLTTDFIPTDGQKVVVYFEGVRLPGVVGTDGEKTWITPRGFLGNMGDYFYVTTIPYPELEPDFKTTNSFYLHYTETDGWSVIGGAVCATEFSIAVYEETAEELPEVFMPAGFVAPNMRCVYSITKNLSTSHWQEQDGYYMGLRHPIDYIPSDAVYCIAVPDADSREVANIANIRAAVFNTTHFCCMADRLPTANVTVTFYFYALT